MEIISLNVINTVSHVHDYYGQAMDLNTFNVAYEQHMIKTGNRSIIIALIILSSDICQ